MTMKTTIDKATRSYIAKLISIGVSKIFGQNIVFAPATYDKHTLCASIVMETPVGAIIFEPYVDQQFVGAHCRVGHGRPYGLELTADQQAVASRVTGYNYGSKMNDLHMPIRKCTRTDAEVIAAHIISHIRTIVRAANEVGARTVVKV